MRTTLTIDDRDANILRARTGLTPHADTWLQQPHVTAVGPGEHHWPILSNLLRASEAAGNLTSDAHVAALAVEYGCTVVLADNYFRLFSGFTHLNLLGA